MKKTKKFLAILLSIIMLFAIAAPAVFAADEQETTEAGYYDVYVTDYYASRKMGTYKAGDTVMITALTHEKPYYYFAGWDSEGAPIRDADLTQQTITFVMPDGNVNLTANYQFSFLAFVQYSFQKPISDIVLFFQLLFNNELPR